MSFNDALDRTMMFEGGYVDDPVDRGGKTKYGISENIWKEYHGNKPPYPIQNITKYDATTIYRNWYWLRPKLNLIDETMPELAIHMFDACVNHGQGNAIKFLQEACNFFGSKLVVDGIMGPKTLTAARNFESKQDYRNALIATYLFMRAKKYESILKNNPSQQKFAKGWMKRLI